VSNFSRIKKNVYSLIFLKAVLDLLNSEQDAEECDATKAK